MRSAPRPRTSRPGPDPAPARAHGDRPRRPDGDLPPRRSGPRRLAAALAVTALTAAAATAVAPGGVAVAAAPGTATPIKHVVVIYDENVSFDHYFGTYPKAANTDGTTFTAAPGTPRPANLLSHHSKLLTHNPNQYQPRRLTPSEALTCDQNHSYGPEQLAYDGGRMDQFVQHTSSDTCTGLYGSPGLTMDYFDGNTVTALWNYAQNYALSDNSYDAVFGPSTPGALDVVSGQTHGGIAIDPRTGKQVPPDASTSVRNPDPATGVGTVFSDPDPAYDDCSDNNHTASSQLAAMKGRNVGDLLNSRNVTWGWFEGGFTPTSSADGGAVCGATHANVGGAASVDYSPHHEPFQYYASTANPHHLPPTSTAMIGHQDQANHQYDLTDFDQALAAGNLPSVSFLKAGSYQDGHAGYSDPLDEQHFLTARINEIQKSPQWASTAVVIAYDDSDGWYDQAVAPIANGSTDTAPDNLGDTPMCASGPPAAGGYTDRCGPGPRLPLMVISPYSKRNYIDHTLTTQASVLRFIEDNWRVGRIGDGSFDAHAGSIAGMLDFRRPQQREVLLAPDGHVALTVPVEVPSGPAGSLASSNSSNPASASNSANTSNASGTRTAAQAADRTRPAADAKPVGASTRLTAAGVTGVCALAVLLAGGAAGSVLLRRRMRRVV